MRDVLDFTETASDGGQRLLDFAFGGATVAFGGGGTMDSGMDDGPSDGSP